jgi:hypothetical protein
VVTHWVLIIWMIGPGIHSGSVATASFVTKESCEAGLAAAKAQVADPTRGWTFEGVCVPVQ